jgi:hypothetical protein
MAPASTTTIAAPAETHCGMFPHATAHMKATVHMKRDDYRAERPGIGSVRSTPLDIVDLWRTENRLQPHHDL